MRPNPYRDRMFFGAMLAAHPLVWALGLTPPMPLQDDPACYSARCIVAQHLVESRDAALARADLERRLFSESIVPMDIETPHPTAEVCLAIDIEMPALELPIQPAPFVARTATHAADSAS